MGMKDDSKKIKDGTLLAQYKENVLRYANQIDIEMAAINTIGDLYGPQERIEANADIANLKSSVQAIINKY
jgi:hypothetical protein